MFWAKRAYRCTRAFYIQPMGTAISLIVSFLAALFLVPSDNLGLETLIAEDLILGAYSLLVFFLFACLVFTVSLIHVVGEKLRLDDLSALAELRAKGIDLWNMGTKFTEEKKVKPWITKYNKWHREVLDLFKTVSPVRAAMWKRAGTYVAHDPNLKLGKPLNDEHAKYIYLFMHMWETLGTYIDAMLVNMEKQE